jgi:hypothetical protein
MSYRISYRDTSMLADERLTEEMRNRRVLDRAGGAREDARTDRRLPLSGDFILGQLRRASGRGTLQPKLGLTVE